MTEEEIKLTLEEMETRLKRLEDIEEIKQLQCHYVNSLINIRWDDLVGCFASDGVANLHMGQAKGKDELNRLFKENIARTHRGLEGVFVAHPIVSVQGDSATGNWILYIQWSLPRKLDPIPDCLTTDDAPDWMQGYYDMEYKRENGVWKIASLLWRCRLVSPRTNYKG
jgi:hypothetical protein